MMNCKPSRYTGIPLARKASTVKSAVHSMKYGRRKSPMGTAKNRNPRGKVRTLATCQPSTAGTDKTMSVTKANWVAAFTATRSPANQSMAAPNISSQASRPGCGTMGANTARWRHTSHSEIRGTTKPCA